MANNLQTPELDTSDITDIITKLDLKLFNEQPFNLILWNDHVNSMDHVAVALFEICELSPEDCIRVMLEAHDKNKTIAKSGSEEEMLGMKKRLNERHIEVTIEQ
jgi:ATP-dependent Clp protease adapter protein ClpS